MLDLLLYLTAATQPAVESARAPSETDCRPVVTLMSNGNSTEAQPARPRGKVRTQPRRPTMRPCMTLASA
jgi:hypothetical protein